MMKSFAQFCDNFTSGLDLSNLEIDSNASLAVPPKYQTICYNICSNVASKMERLDSLSISYIEAFFDKYTKQELDQKLHDMTEEDEIPDGMINYMAYNLYGTVYNELLPKQKAIINVLSIYSLLQN